MTSSSILPTLACTNSTLMDFLPVQTNVSSMSLPVNTLDICYHRRPHHGPIQSPDHPRLANTMKSQGYSIFPRLCQLYCHFIYRYSEITVPLTHLNHKGTPWHFSNECHSAFEALKKAFTTSPVLTHWILDTQITVETDTSDYTLAAVLSIMTPKGDLHPIA